MALGLIMVSLLLMSHVLSSKQIVNFARRNAPDVEALVDVSALRHSPAYFILTVTVVSFVLAGLREELWRSAFLAGFRRLWPRYFAGRLGEMKAIVLAALLFGAAHAIQGPIAIVLTTLLGIGLGAIMVFHRSIWPAVFAHGFWTPAMSLVYDRPSPNRAWLPTRSRFKTMSPLLSISKAGWNFACHVSSS